METSNSYLLVCISVAVVVILQLQVATSLSCLPCDPASCPTLRCPGGTARDPCGCCQVCAKQAQELCGGMFEIEGHCDKNLTCVIQPNYGDLLTGSEVGICKPTHFLTSSDICHQASYVGCNIINQRCECGSQVSCTTPFQYQTRDQCNQHRIASTRKSEKCKRVKCRVRQSRHCPQDSVLVEGYVPPGECCPSPSRCECKAEKCTYNLCPPNTRRALVSTGTNQPGSCCDIYRCIPQANNVDCSEVDCAVQSLSSISCPLDSMAVRNPFPSNPCCPGEPICQCRKRQCRRPKCSGNKQLKVAYRGNRHPGSCCDKYTCTNDIVMVGCSVNGTQYRHGSAYKRGKCGLCECKMGVSSCGPLTCPDLSTCTRVTMNKDDCCPTCLDGSGKDHPVPLVPYPLCKSEDNRRTYEVGETWSTDPCTHCTCSEGGVTRCIASFCQEPILATATPTCPSPSSCSLTDFDCRYGFEYDDQGCRVCHCKTDVEGCAALTGCESHCPRGFVADRSGCDICQCRQKKCKELTSCRRQCPFGYKQNKKGCDRCKCRRCPPINSCDKDCKFGLAENKYGCSICKCKASPPVNISTPLESLPSQPCNDVQTGGRRDDGESWSSSCSMCMCRGGDVLCEVVKCPIPRCTNPVFKPEACCSTCSGDETNSLLFPRALSCRETDDDWFVEGESWNVDQCTSCTCHHGHVMCTSKVCSPAPCDNPVYDETLCCSKCPETATPASTDTKSCQNDAGTIYENGNAFHTDHCTSCLCLEGVIECFSAKCPQELPCENPVLKKGMCCPQCLGDMPSSRSCNDNGKILEHSEEWNKTSDGCTKCSCVNGSVKCHPPKCDPIPKKCRRIYRRHGSCCEECILEETEPPVITCFFPEKDTTKVVRIAVGVGLACIFIGTLILLGICIKRRCVHAGNKYTRGSPATDSRQNHIENKSSSLRSGSTGTARTNMVSSSSEDERTFKGEQ